MFLPKLLTLSCTSKQLHRDRKHFCHYCFQSFATAYMLERYVNDSLKLMTKKSETVKIQKLYKKNIIATHD